MMVTMAADSNATRQARHRRHKRGDHSACGPRCEDSRASLRVVPVPAASAENLDPAAALADLAVRLEAVHRADPLNMAAAKELRECLVRLPGARDNETSRAMDRFIRSLSMPVEVTGPYDDGG